MDKPCVVLVGNLNDGYKVYGPFQDFDSAASWSGMNADVWIMTLEDMSQECPEER